MSPMEPWLAGLLGGLLASVAFTFITLPVLKGFSLPSFVISKVLHNESPGLWIVVGGSFLHYIYGGAVGVVFGILTVSIFDVVTLWLWGIAFGALMLVLAAITWISLSGGVGQINSMPPRRRNVYALNAVVAHLVFGFLIGLITGDFRF